MFREHRIVIVMEGGLIQDIFCNGEQPDILVCDFDMEGGMGKETMESPAGDIGYHRPFEPQVERGLVEAWFERWKKHEAEAEKKEEADETGNAGTAGEGI